MPAFEKIGVFYLGRPYDLAKKAPKEGLLLYDSRDLVTHAVCVGMTGSGKTGLCLSLIEEAAIDGLPAILIDPKGDLCDLLLTFPDLKPEDFRPWINEEDAARRGVSPDEFARQQAEVWKKGLAEWGQDGERIRRLQESADFVIYTPGSTAGLPVSILRSFAAPSAAERKDEEALRDRVGSTTTGILTLLGIEADPLQSREHILLSTVLTEAWTKGEDLDLATLLARLETPPVSRIGVVDLESFYPAKERFALAMRLNNLLAAPGFATWLEGEPLEMGGILRTRTGKPRVAIFSIAHLADAERMFFVTLLLNQTLAWMRSQSGTTSLRAVLYMDEIAGYFPPVATPPAKAPLLTLLKQARAFGLGVVLATQNPVDLDYKGLANTGTWFLGRLQTERDKARVLEGLEGAAAGSTRPFDRGKMERLLAGLGHRIFLMSNVHEDAPEVFETRWALSYLRGPLTRAQIKTLMDPRRADASPEAEPKTKASASPSAAGRPDATDRPPMLPPDIPQLFAPAHGSSAAPVYHPGVLGMAEVHFADPKSGDATTATYAVVAGITESAAPVRWESAEELSLATDDLSKTPAGGARFETLPRAAATPSSYAAWKKDLATWIYREKTLEVLRSPSSGEASRPGETEAEFRSRLQQGARERRDAAAQSLRQKYASRLASLQDRLLRAQQSVDRERQEATQAKIQTAISVGATVLGAILGRKAVSATTIGRATTSARGVGRTMKQAGDVARAQETAEEIQRQISDLNAALEAEIDSLSAATDPLTEKLEKIVLRPKKTDITIRQVALLWMPRA